MRMRHKYITLGQTDGHLNSSSQNKISIKVKGLENDNRGHNEYKR